MFRGNAIAVVLMLALTAGLASAVVTTSPEDLVVAVDNSSALTGYVTQDIVVDFAGQSSGFQLLITLTQGTIYQDANGTNVAPAQATINAHPSAAFDTFVGLGGRTTETAAGSFMLGGGAFDLGGGATAVFSASQISQSWFPSPGVVVTNRSDFFAARITLSNNAQGTWAFLASDGQIRTYAGTILNGAMEFPLTVMAGDHTLLADTPGQTFPIQIIGPSGTRVMGTNLYVQVENGQAGNGNITNIEADLFEGLGTPTYVDADSNVPPYPALGGLFIVSNDPNNDPVPSGVLATVTIDTTGMEPGTYALVIDSTHMGSSSMIEHDTLEEVGSFINGTITIQEAAPDAAVQGVYAFYNQCSFDGNNVAANASDDAAIAMIPRANPDAVPPQPLLPKTALLPGQIPSNNNVITFFRGINGIMVDVSNLAGTVTASDFVIKYSGVATGSLASNYTTTALPGGTPTGVSVRTVGGNSRVTLIFPNFAVNEWGTGVNRNSRWMQVTVLANANTGLATPYVFYFGLAISDTGNSTANFQVTSADQGLIRTNPRTALNPAPIDFKYDINRDGTVTATDQALSRTYITTTLNNLLKYATAAP